MDLINWTSIYFIVLFIRGISFCIGSQLKSLAGLATSSSPYKRYFALASDMGFCFICRDLPIYAIFSYISHRIFRPQLASFGYRGSYIVKALCKSSRMGPILIVPRPLESSRIIPPYQCEIWYIWSGVWPSQPAPTQWYGLVGVGGGAACAERGEGRWSCSWRNGQASQIRPA